MHFLLLNILLAFFIALSRCEVKVAFSLDEQLPLVARVGKPYEWSFSNRTFDGVSQDGVKYSVSNLPAWLSFDSTQRRFLGTPSPDHAGNTKITVTASETGSPSTTTVASSFVLCVVSSAEPVVAIPLSSQLSTPKSSLSSVFNLGKYSALATGNPALRVPPRWSFSIGLELDTLKCDGDVFYDVRQLDASYLPSWMSFNFKERTLNGVVPNETILSKPTIFPLNLHASDVEGYSAVVLPFDIIISQHDLSMSTGSLATIDVPLSTEFHIALPTAEHLREVLVDGRPLHQDEIDGVSIDTSQYPWLHYDQSSRSLSGILSPEESNSQPFSLPVLIQTVYQQDLRAVIILSSSPSFFVSSDLPPVTINADGIIDLSIDQFCSNATCNGQTDISVALDPPDSSRWLGYESKTNRLVGHVPVDFSGGRVNATFTAHSRSTGATYHARLPILLESAGGVSNGAIKSQAGQSSTQHRRRLVLGLSITFGVIGGFCLLGIFLAIFRRCARVPDTALGEEAGQNAWGEHDKRWYGIASASAGADQFQSGSESDLSTKEEVVPELSRRPPYGDIGFGLRRFSERSQADISNHGTSIQSTGVMSKRDFMARVKHTIRIVSDKARNRTVSKERPVISRPILPLNRNTTTSDILGLITSFEAPPSGFLSTPASTIVTQSPSGSTGEQSIPVRRADFSAPRKPRRSYEEHHRRLADAGDRRPLFRQNSTESGISFNSETSVKTHAAEAVVQKASKTTSLGGSSKHSMVTGSARARLVPFSSGARVPVPVRPINNSGPSSIKRIPSQKATVHDKNDVSSTPAASEMRKNQSNEDLSIGLQLAENLGQNATNLGLKATPQKASPAKDKIAIRIRPEEPFQLPIRLLPLDPEARQKSFQIKRLNGNGRPASFICFDQDMLKTRGLVELSGTPGQSDVGKYVMGIYEEGRVCIATATVDVVQWH